MRHAWTNSRPPSLCRALLVIVLAAMLVWPRPAHGYSVLTHEVIIDMLWDTDIQPLLLQRFPLATPDDLKVAHAYAYGGAVIQDMGYYPFGNQQFSNLVHYVRSGDFVINLLRESQDIKEYAFALGALSHYAADITGHPAINESVALEYPNLREKYGPIVTYDENPEAHIRVEFGFDVLQVATGRFNFDQYHDFVGFEVAQALLERAFYRTYGIPLHDVISRENLAIGTYRWSVSRAVPEMTKVALVWRGNRMASEIPSFDRKRFLYRLSRADFEKEWGTKYQRPGIGARILGVILRIIPHVGPFKAVKYKDPTPHTEQMYFRSVNQTVDVYRSYLRMERENYLAALPDVDFDTSQKTRPGEYALTDLTYSRLVRSLASHRFRGITPDLKTNILNFYRNPIAKDAVQSDQHAWQRTMEAVDQLRIAPTVSVEAEQQQPTTKP